MSDRERERLVVLKSVEQGLRTQVEASELLSLSTRQVRRLLGRLKADGDGALVHKLRGRPSNRRVKSEVTFGTNGGRVGSTAE